MAARGGISTNNFTFYKRTHSCEYSQTGKICGIRILMAAVWEILNEKCINEKDCHTLKLKELKKVFAVNPFNVQVFVLW